MSLIKIQYGELEDAAKRAGNAAEQLTEYAGHIRSYVTDPLGTLPGSDSAGHVSDAAALARSKMTALNTLADKYTNLSGNLSSFVALAREKDTAAAGKIESIVDGYVGTRSWFQRAGDAISGFFVDLMNGNPLFRNIKNLIDRGAYHVGNACESIYNFFKYGDGIAKYIVDIVLDVAEVLVAAVLVVGALTATALSGAWLVALVVACSVYIVCKFVNMAASVQAKSDAMAEYGENPSLARYHAKADGLKERVKTQDYGGAFANGALSVTGTGVNVAETVSGLYIAGAMLYTKLVDVKVYNPNSARYGQHIRYQPTKNVVRNNIKSSMGFDRYTGKWSLSKMFKPDLSLGTDKLSSLKGSSGLVKAIYGSALVADTLDGLRGNLADLADFSKSPSIESGVDAAEATFSLAGEVPYLEMPKKLFIDPIFKFKGLVEAFE